VAAPAADIKGSKDHPVVSRYAGSEIVKYKQRAFDEYFLLTRKAKKSGGIEKNKASATTLEGRITAISYKAPAERTTLEVFRNYQDALQQAGFETLFACSNKECGGRGFNHAVVPYDLLFGDYYSDQRYLAAKLSRPTGDVYVALYTVFNRAPNIKRAITQLDVIEVKAMAGKMVTVDANAMAKGIEAEGHIAIYNLYFDTGKAVIKPSSEPALGEIAKLLEVRPTLGLLVVGHTDNVGKLKYNEDLSRRRAQAVVEALTGKHGVAPGRLSAVGVGMYAPIASNQSEPGRAKNRRVELVER
jgi:outer membrane protein OmpA-like peptidoglycan-associated protein